MATQSAEDFLRDLRRREIEDWDPYLASVEAVMRNVPGSGGGGLTGVEDEYHRVRAALIRRGQRALDWEAKLAELGRHHRSVARGRP